MRASFFASAGLDRARRKSSTDKRVFFVGPAAVWHCKIVGVDLINVK